MSMIIDYENLLLERCLIWIWRNMVLNVLRLF